MNETVYQELAKVLDTLPNGFPATESGIELQILQKIFRPEDAALFCDLRLQFETPEQIAERTGRSLKGLEQQLDAMRERGQIFMATVEGTPLVKMVPWAFGIYEFQCHRMDRELAEMCDAYMPVFGRQFFTNQPQLMQVIPVEKEIPGTQQSLHYEQVSNIIENSQSHAVFECVCKKEKHLLEDGCDKPLEICTAYAPIPGVFDDSPHHRAISKEEAYAVLDKAEEAALVHLTWNVKNGHFFICNCCGCCCNVLRSINELGIDASTVINAYYYAQIDADTCVACGVCKDERCQVNAIEEDDDAYRIVPGKCIGCGLCLSTCPSEAITLIRKAPEEITPPPVDELQWFEERGMNRGVDFNKFK